MNNPGGQQDPPGEPSLHQTRCPSRNSRNGFTPKRLGTEVGDLELATPRDRNGSFEPRLVTKGQRRVGGLSDMIVSLYAEWDDDP